MTEPVTELDTILDTCLAKIKAEGWSIEDCLAQYPIYREALEGPLRIAARLQRAQAIAPSLRFKENASERLQARLQSSSRPPVSRSAAVRAPAHIKSNRWLFPALRRFVVLPAALGLIVALAAGTTGVAYAADGAVPGDSLYSIDRGVEQLELSLTQDPNKALRRQVAFTDERLGEAEQLAAQGDAALLDEAISNYDQSVLDITRLAETADEQVDESLSQLLDQTFSKHQAKLEKLLEKVPEQAKKGIERALEASSQGRDNALKALKEHGNKDDDDRPGNGPPERTPKPPNKGKGNGPPDGNPGNGRPNN
jgi:hypothetical protein